MTFVEKIWQKAASDKKTIVLPESMDERTYKAAEAAVKKQIADIIIIGTPEEIEAHKGDCDITGITIIDPNTSEKTKEYADLFVELRKA